MSKYASYILIIEKIIKMKVDMIVKRWKMREDKINVVHMLLRIKINIVNIFKSDRCK